MFAAFIHGITLAFGLILPLGAQNVFVFNQGATQPNWKKALPAIITASLCDTLLIILSVLGISVVVFTVPMLQKVLYLVGLLFLIYMGWSVWNSVPPNTEKKATAMGVKKQILFAMSVSLMNPHAILDTIGVIGMSSLGYDSGEKAVYTGACILISWLWFAGLALAGRTVGQFDTQGKWLVRINKVSALIIWIVAIYIAVQLFKLL